MTSSIPKSFRFYAFVFFSSLVLTFFSFLTQSYASITLKITVVNPSSEKQVVPVKVYLPIEVKPQDILYKEDLEVAYDAQLGSYYVFREYEMAPSDVLEKEIEINDIWVIPDVEIETLRQESKRLKTSADKTPVAQSINVICAGIDKKLDDITKMQATSATNPPQHISDYRYCAELLKGIKNDLSQARTMLAQAGTKPTLAATIWKIIIFIIVFLGLLGLSFYLIWQRQAGLMKDVAPPEPKEDLVLPEKGSDKPETQDKEPSSPDDIEKIIREGE